VWVQAAQAPPLILQAGNQGSARDEPALPDAAITISEKQGLSKPADSSRTYGYSRRDGYRGSDSGRAISV
jgi:hypothetical protein